LATYRKSVLLRSTRKVARVVDRAALEMRCTGDCTGGSNPSLSARRKGEQSSPGQKIPAPQACLRGLGFFWPVRCPRHRLSSVLGSSEWVSRRDAVIPPPRKLACRGWIFLAGPMPPASSFLRVGILRMGITAACRNPRSITQHAVIPPRKPAENK
jgi:hypothetical protein